MEYRTEHDSMGEVQVPADRYWGAQTQRSYQNFRIGIEKIPNEVIRAFAILKKAAALTIYSYNKFREEVCQFECRISIPQLQVRGALSGG